MSRLAAVVYLTAISLAGVGVTLGIVGESRGLDLPAMRESLLPVEVICGVATVLFGTVGLVVARRQRENAIGWIFLSSAFVLGLTAAVYGYADLALYGGEGWRLADWAGWLASWSLGLPLFVAPCFVALLFPDGRPPSPFWRRVLWLGVAFAILVVTAQALRSGPLDPYPDVASPAAPADGVAGVIDALAAFLEAILFPLFFVAALAAFVARFRRSRGVERLQLKWVAYAAAVLVISFTASFVVESLDLTTGWPSDVLFLTGVAGFVLLPLAVGLAILRYRLYEIDRLISRTLVYGSLTVFLGAAYLGLVLAGQAVFSSFAGGSDLAIAVSTLLVAALFLPVRARVQGFVDRRFYRRRYDAQRTLAAFGSRLREQVELEALTADLAGVVAGAMQPAHVSLWLRQETGT